MNRQMSETELSTAVDVLVRRAIKRAEQPDPDKLAEALGPAELLAAAARLVEDSMTRMNLKFDACPHCGHRQYANRRESKAAEKLAAQAASLRLAASRLRGEVA